MKIKSGSGEIEIDVGSELWFVDVTNLVTDVKVIFVSKNGWNIQVFIELLPVSFWLRQDNYNALFTTERAAKMFARERLIREIAEKQKRVEKLTKELNN